MEYEKLSEEARWFLKNLQALQDEFVKDIVGAQIVITDKEGNLVTKMSGQQRACQIIQSTQKGKEQCAECYKQALSLVRTQKEPLFMDCYAGFASLWVPIKVNGEVVGSITGCGGRYDKGETREELEEKYLKLAEELGIEDKEDFLKAAIDEVGVVTQEEMQKRAERLAKLVSILAEETALGEVFGITS